MNDYPPPSFDMPMAQPAAGVTTAKKAAKEGKPPTRRMLSTQRKLFLAFAVVVALGAVFLLTKPAPVVYVARAAADIPALTEVTESQIEAAPVSPESVEPGALSSPDASTVLKMAAEQILGKKAFSPIFLGQQLRPQMVADGVALATPLGPDERLVSIGARAAGSVAGTIVPGDRVDIYVAAPDGLTGILAQDVEVVAVTVRPDQLDNLSSTQLAAPNKTLGDLVPSKPIPGTYIVRVADDMVAKFIAGDSGGTLYMVLRGVDASDYLTPPSDVRLAICANFADDPLCTGTAAPQPNETEAPQ